MASDPRSVADDFVLRADPRRLGPRLTLKIVRAKDLQYLGGGTTAAGVVGHPPIGNGGMNPRMAEISSRAAIVANATALTAALAARSIR